MVDVQRDQPLFDKLLPLQIQANQHDSRQASLVFRILQGSQATNVIGQNEVVYHFEVTDDRDPYFVFYFDVGEQDFPQFKRDQCILVDFHVFPQKMIELLELCLKSSQVGEFIDDDNSQMTSSIPSTFTAKLDLNSGVFSVIEANKFKQLTHICLPLREGDDAAIKQYLASRLSLTLDVAKRQQRELESLSTRLQSEEEVNEKMSKDILELRTQKSVDLQSMQASHSHEMSSFQRQVMDAQEQNRVKYESQLEHFRNLLEQTQQDLHNRSLTLEQQIADLTHEKHQLEFKLRDNSRQLAVTEQDRDRLLKECEEYHGQRRSLDDDRSSLQREVLRLESKVEALLQQLHDREENMQKTSALHKASEDARFNMEEKLHMVMKHNDELQEEIACNHDEMNKFTNVIGKLNAEMKMLKDKMKLKNEVIRRQELLVNELRLKSADLEHQLTQSKDAHQTGQHQITLLQSRVNEANERADELQKTIAEQKSVIAYLNDEMNKIQLGERANAEPMFPKSSFLPPSAQKYGSPVTPTNAFGAASGRAVNTPSTVIAKYASNTHTGSSPEAKASHHSTKAYQSNINYLVQDNKSASVAMKALIEETSLKHKSKNDSDIYLKGIKNLGLTAALNEDDLGFDVINGLNSDSSAVSLDAAYFQSSNNNKPTHSRPTVPAGRDVDLDAIDYYAMDRNANTAAAPKPQYKYEWQSPNFGRDD